MLNGSALVLLRIASDSVERDDVANLRHQRRRIGDRVNADGQHDADEDQQRRVPRWLQRVSAIPAMQHNNKRESDDDDAAGLEVVGRRAGGEPDWVPDVEQPVSEATQRLGADRRERHRLERLGVRQHVGAMTGLHDQHRDPPQRHAEAQPADAQRGRRAPAAT